MKKYFKIYTHNLHSLRVKTFNTVRTSPSPARKVYNLAFGLCYYVGLAIWGAAVILGKIAFGACYHTGNAIWKTARTAARQTADELRRTKNYSLRRLDLLLR